MRMRTILTSTVLATGCLAALAHGAPVTTSAVYPTSIAVIGDGDVTGYASDPKRPFQEARANSWATGTNPAVRSIYSRLLAAKPAIRGRAFNFGSVNMRVPD